ncbi:MAG: hypothetical protein H6532_06245 [Thermoleophilales bacterium]|nr:hypothetical protein [Thermoleophilales bacterium]
MRRPKKPGKQKPAISSEDTQEMFTAGETMPPDPEETREYALEPVEEEVWEEDQYEDWDEEPDEPLEKDEVLDDGLLDDVLPEDELPDDDVEGVEALEDEPPPEVTGEPDESGTSKTEERFAELGKRLRALWTGALTRVGSIKLPSHEVSGQKALAVGGIVVIALLVGTGGYLLGKGSGDDLDRAKLEGQFAGKRAGAIAGATKGYAAGFKKGRDVAFRKSYTASYRRNYIRAYDNAGMDAPKAKDIEVPRP